MSFILVTGIPGSGKSTLSEAIAKEIDCKVLHVTDLIKDKKFYVEIERDSCGDPLYVVDMDKLEEYVRKLDGCWIIEGVVVDFVPPEKVKKVIYLYAPVKILYERMSSKGYCRKKICDNLEAELVGSYFQILLEEYNGKVSCLDTSRSLESTLKEAISIIKCLKSPCSPHPDEEWEDFFRLCPLE
ncbi:hypothetical protein EYM_00310 [Ignicoccus islandicus DSM 13165]|uniref:Adenylate kinase n=1 Tax=Ignicoccus islandicus DSM 13165 TaxID=940295 RepID=A0A0U3F7U7_9CREN|nr:AAA family ATPase [Ignicoccus islandicus]ALU12104.1 hypothetical protein EYM_00310 [Ignicoccus islandicus DSM 13165]